ncbi:MAG: DNA repair protein RecO, partial [Spirulinaceae cyanobacterium RM2_2_10]|nr:DNA repair protein RecO [Spirulinaceae cyanobacterium RM2_2_10]
MSQTYQATGINLKSLPFGETDRLVTVLTAEFGLLRAVAPGARKPKSRLRGRIEPFVINQLLVVRGRSLDRIIQAETQHSYPGLSKDLAKLTIAQYWAEIALSLGLSDQPQIELYAALNASLVTLERQPHQSPEAAARLLACLNSGVLQLLAVGGLTPQLQACCRSGQPLTPVIDNPDWRVGFSIEAGGLVDLAVLAATGSRMRPTATLTAGELITLRQLTDLEHFDRAAAILISKVRTLAAMTYRMKEGKPFIYPKAQLKYAS